MGYLKGYENIARAVKHNPELPSEEAIEAFQIEVFNLISEAYQIIKTPSKITEKPDETQISISLFAALKVLCSNGSWVNCEHHEFTEEIFEGSKKSISAKRFDLYFGNWNTPKRIEYGIEAKLLVENDYLGLKSKFLVEEYVSERGMNKYITGIYKQRGCMIGYIVEGETTLIVNKINEEIERVLDSSQKLLIETTQFFQHNAVYKSFHKEKLIYPLFHLMLDFN